MNVLFLTWEYPPVGAGIGSYTREMGQALQQAGHRAVVVTGNVAGLPERSETDAGTVYRMYDPTDIGSPDLVDRVLQIASDHDIDWVEGADHWGEAAAFLRRASRPPVVIKAHSSNALRVLWNSQVLHAWQRPMVQLARWRARHRIRDERYCLTHGDVLLAPSERILRELRDQGVALPARTGVIRNPVCQPSEPIGPEDSRPTILLAGRIDIGKGIQYLPALMRRLAADVPDARLEIAGSDTYARGLGSMQAWLTAQLGPDASRVHFLGRLDAAQMHAAYGRAWVVIVPSRWDNFPTVVLEAMVRGKAIVASPNGGMPEMLAATSCPVEDPGAPAFAEAVVTLLRDRHHRQEAGQSAQRKATSDFSPQAVAAAYVALLEGVVPPT